MGYFPYWYGERRRFHVLYVPAVLTLQAMEGNIIESRPRTVNHADSHFLNNTQVLEAYKTIEWKNTSVSLVIQAAMLPSSQTHTQKNTFICFLTSGETVFLPYGLSRSPPNTVPTFISLITPTLQSFRPLHRVASHCPRSHILSFTSYSHFAWLLVLGL